MFKQLQMVRLAINLLDMDKDLRLQKTTNTNEFATTLATNTTANRVPMMIVSVDDMPSVNDMPSVAWTPFLSLPVSSVISMTDAMLTLLSISDTFTQSSNENWIISLFLNVERITWHERYCFTSDSQWQHHIYKNISLSHLLSSVVNIQFRSRHVYDVLMHSFYVASTLLLQIRQDEEEIMLGSLCVFLRNYEPRNEHTFLSNLIGNIFSLMK